MGSSFNIYTTHFGMSERPFSLVPDPDFMFWSEQHLKAYSILEYGVLTGAPITVLTGEVGAGKTTIIHHLLNSMEDDVKIALIANVTEDRGELVRWVLMALGQTALPSETYVDLFARFQQYLIDQYAGGRRVVLIFDEAQNLSRETLEELRMYTNINSNKDELLQLVLVGQPELRELVERPDLTQFAQRVGASFHLGSMNLEMVQNYIKHRLQAVGANPDLFSNEACSLIWEASGGIPRLVNQLSDMALVYTYAKAGERVEAETIVQILDDRIFIGLKRPAKVAPLLLGGAQKVE